MRPETLPSVLISPEIKNSVEDYARAFELAFASLINITPDEAVEKLRQLEARDRDVAYVIPKGVKGYSFPGSLDSRPKTFLQNQFSVPIQVCQATFSHHRVEVTLSTDSKEVNPDFEFIPSAMEGVKELGSRPVFNLWKQPELNLMSHLAPRITLTSDVINGLQSWISDALFRHNGKLEITNETRYL